MPSAHCISYSIFSFSPMWQMSLVKLQPYWTAAVHHNRHTLFNEVICWSVHTRQWHSRLNTFEGLRHIGLPSVSVLHTPIKATKNTAIKFPKKVTCNIGLYTDRMDGLIGWVQLIRSMFQKNNYGKKTLKQMGPNYYAPESWSFHLFSFSLKDIQGHQWW